MESLDVCINVFSPKKFGLYQWILSTLEAPQGQGTICTKEGCKVHD